jgi:hypothetical protein
LSVAITVVSSCDITRGATQRDVSCRGNCITHGPGVIRPARGGGGGEGKRRDRQ